MIEITTETLWKWLIIGNIPVYVLIASLFWGSPWSFLSRSVDHPLDTWDEHQSKNFDLALFLILCVGILLAEYQVATRFFVTLVE